MPTPIRLIDLAPRMEAAFGIIPLIPQPQPIPGEMYLPVLGAVRTYANGGFTYDEMELTGNPGSGRLTLSFKNMLLTKSGSLGSIFAPPPMIKYAKRKTIVTTRVEESDTEVVERYGDGSWEMNIRGLLVDMEAHTFPLRKLEQLRKFFEIRDAIDAYSDIMDALGISSLYFSDIDIDTVAGFGDTVQYTLTARSIKPVEFFLNGEQ